MRKPLLPVLVLMVLVVAACATLRPDADPFLTRSEQSLAVAVDALDAFFYLERSSETALENATPGTHARAEQLRQRAPDIIRAVEAALDSYRDAPGDTTKMEVQRYLALAQTLAQQAQAIMAKWGGVE